MFENLTNRIQQLQGFENFHKGVMENQFVAAAGRDTIIVVNITAFRCDAIALSSQGIKAIPLKELDFKTAGDWIRKPLAYSNKMYIEFLGVALAVMR